MWFIKCVRYVYVFQGCTLISNLALVIVPVQIQDVSCCGADPAGVRTGRYVGATPYDGGSVSLLCITHQTPHAVHSWIT